jgi:hypothetical protein
MIVHSYGFQKVESIYKNAAIKKINGIEYIIADGRYYIKWDLGRFTDFCYKVQEYMDYTDNPHTRPTERPIINNESLCAYMMVANVIDIKAEIEKVEQSLKHLQTFKNKLK